MNIYVLDSGVQPHSEFGARILRLSEFDPYASIRPPGVFDCAGHGTHAASVAAGATVGVASDATVVPVVIANCDDFINTNTLRDQLELLKNRLQIATGERSVINIATQILDAPTDLDQRLLDVRNMGDTPVVVAAGQVNSASQPTTRLRYWPQRIADVLRVGMTNNLDQKADNDLYPNGFACGSSPLTFVYHISGSSIFAPAYLQHGAGGVFLECGIRAASATGSGYFITRGTSVAAPQVAGVIAHTQAVNTTYRQRWWSATQAVTENAIGGVVTGTDSGDINALLYTNFAMVASRNAASYAEGLAADSICAAFGAFGTTPTSVALLQTQTGSETPMALVTGGANPSQVNYYVPAGVPVGTYYVRVKSGGAQLGSGAIRINRISPGLFTANGSGTGTAAGQLWFYDKQTGAQTSIQNLVSGGNNWNPATHDVYLILYGTGVRGYNGFASVRFIHDNLLVTGTPILHVGAVQGITGQDQVNIGPLPASMASVGTWQIELTVGQAGGPNLIANIVTMRLCPCS